MVNPQAAILFHFFSKDLQFALIFGWRLAGWLSRSLPQHLCIPDCSARVSTGMRFANWRQQNQNEIDWVLQGLLEEHPRSAFSLLPFTETSMLSGFFP